ncbi:MAG: hypothetical protein JW936_05185 [Sedimentisphaerales bacterium]|nr:hypothetical protein [Sedimentisphaerales bacterium]
MSSIPPNIAMALMQAQFAAKEAAKPADTERNKRVRDSRQLAQLADQQQHEVENTSEAELILVMRDGDQEREHRHSGDDGDTFESQLAEAEAAAQSSVTEEQLTVDDNGVLDEDSSSSGESDDASGHIDLSA